MSIEQLAEAYAVPGIGNPVDRTEFLYDDPSFGLGTWALGATTLSDRKDGKFFPVYQCETDLAMQRAQARALCGITRIHDGAMDALANYTFGQGFTFEATCKAPGDHAPLMAYVQRIIDEFCDLNGMAGDLDREIHSRSRQDGEAFVKLRCDREGKIRAQILEPDQITEPGDARAVEDYEGLCRSIEDSPLNWAFGIATEKEDSSCVVGYYVKTDDGGADWEYLPIGRMQHFKRNVTRNAKRGVTDFYGIFSDFLNEAKLRRNSTTGAAVQAAIAWIVQYAPGVTSSQATSVGMTNSVATVGQATQGGIVQKNALHNPPGTVLRTGAGQTFMPGPMGAERNAGFVEIAQYALRAIGQRWNAPEYLISGDASNANYASSLVAESPFVKARQADQHWYGQQFKSLLWKVIEFHHRAGRFERFGCSMESLRHWCDIVVNYPTVESRNLGETAQALKILVDDLGIMSKRTAATKVDLDLDEELKQGAEAKALPQPMGLVGGFGGMMGGPGGMPGGPDGMPGGALRGQQPEQVAESWDESKHPRDDNGRWVDAGEISAARKDNAKADSLRKRVTNKTERAKLENALADVAPSTGIGGKIADAVNNLVDRSIGATRKMDPSDTASQTEEKKAGKPKQTETNEFKAWFGDSKVVDADGKPKIVYHGTDASFDEFDNSVSVKNAAHVGKAFYFTDDAGIANDFSNESGGNVKPVYLSVSRPFNFDSEVSTDEAKAWAIAAREIDGKAKPSRIIANLDKLQDYNDRPNTGHDLWKAVASETTRDHANAVAQKMGYDGIVHRSSDVGGSVADVDTKAQWGNVYIVFKPNQIKSAIGNKGTFDPKSPKLNESTALESAITAALESVKTSAEARAILEQLTAAESTGCESLNV